MRKVFCIIPLFYVLSTSARPASPYTEREKEMIMQQGQIFTIQLTQKEPIKFYVLGREEARLNPKTLQVKVRRITPYPARDLPIRFEGDYYYIPQEPADSPLHEIEITTSTKQNTETFKIELKKP